MRQARKRHNMWDLETIERMNDTGKREGSRFVVKFADDPDRRERFSGDMMQRAYQWALLNAHERPFLIEEVLS
jgi:hypothetical protein